MQYRRLGGSDLNVSVIAFGAWQLGDPAYWGVDDRADAAATVHAALDGGVNFFDTAELYGQGQSEEALGEILGAKRKDVCIASKVSPDHCAPSELRAACENSLRRLGTDFLDLYQVHWPFRHVPFDDACAELLRLRDEGKIRWIGVSNFGPTDLRAWLSAGPCVSNQLGYSILFRAIEYETLPLCRDCDIGVMAYMPLMQGLLSGRWASADDVPQNRRRTRHFAGSRPGVRHGGPGCEKRTFDAIAQLKAVAQEWEMSLSAMAIAWTLARPGIATAALGARKPEQLLENLRGADLSLTSSMLERIDAISDPLKQELGPNPDLWLSGSDARIR
ncbi:MAG TPA: aldo/keto reductase [Candidatus Hydrogenedentes bacterium]|nr:aldo/keto reductase [Candidatus Hydrogenedentota bacterium]